MLPTFFTPLSPIPRLPLKKKKKKKVRGPYSSSLQTSPLFFGFQVTKYDIRSCTHLPNVNTSIKNGTKGRNPLFFGGGGDIFLRASRNPSAVSAHIFLLPNSGQLFGVRIHYLNDPLCFSQSGIRGRLINLTCLLGCTRRGQTHIAYSTPALRHPLFLPPLPYVAAAIKKHMHFIITPRLSYK